MKIGILTFHWATNYGAVLQAYALSTYLKKSGCNVQIIDYLPYTGRKTLFKCFISKSPSKIIKNLLDFLKEIKFRKFRTSYLNVSKKYASYDELRLNPPDYDVYICGSDQIWNPYFTLKGERKQTLSYFLGFGDLSAVRIAYAVSFGCSEYPDNVLNIALPFIKQFNAISVREKSGIEILKKVGINNVYLMPDPTLLLNIDEYRSLFSNLKQVQADSIFFYVLQSNQLLIDRIKHFIECEKKSKVIDSRSILHSTMGVSRWLNTLCNSTHIVTNSFHGVVFSLLFHKSFIVVPIEGSNSGMNDRIYTLLQQVDLSNRLVSDCNADNINYLLYENIKWDTVDLLINNMQERAGEFFNEWLHKNH